MIACLPADVRGGLRSGVAVGSLGQCVEELALNSIDADATCVAVRVNAETFKVQVADNGWGMGRRDLDRMGKRYFTSKCQSLRDLEHPKFHGFRGEAVASIVNLASAVEVSSKARGAGETLVKLFQGGRGLAAWAAASPRPSAGTTVTVHSLFHRLPVRRKRLDPRLELEQARQRLEALALAHPATSFSLRNDASGCVLLQLRKASDTRSRFCQLHGLAKARKLREVCFQHQEFELSGYISSEAHYNKRLQFLFVNKRLVLRTRLHRLMDFLLRRESVICRPSQPMDSSPPRQRSNPELHGIYVINIRCPAGEYDVCLDPTKTLIEFKNWDVVLVCVQEGIRTFLKQEQLLMELPSDDIKELNEDSGLTLLDAVLPPVASEEKSVQSSFQEACGTMRDSYEIFNTKSKTVKRKAAAENTTGKTWKSGGQTKDGQVNSCADDMCFRDTVEASVCCQDDASSEPGLLTKQAAKFTESGKNDTENTCLEFECSEGSEVLKNPSQASPRCEDSREDTCLLKEKIHDGGVCEEPQQRPPPFGKIALETQDTRKEDERTRRVSNCDGGKTQFGTGQVQLCSTGFITHVMQTQPSKASETDFPTKHVQPGPVSARQIFGNRNQGSAETPNVDLSIHLSEVSTQFSNQNVGLTRMKEGPKTKSTGISKNKTVFHKKSSKRPHPSSLLSNASLAFPWNVHIAHNGKKTEELMVHRKPHLLSQPVSFEKFRRQIRKVESSLPIRIQDLSDDFEKTTHDDFQKENGGLDHSNSCQMPTIINNEPSHSDPSISHVSSGQFPASEEEEKWERQNACGRESPRPPTTDCAQRHRKSLNVNRPLGSLASKLSRMKGHSKEAFITQSIGRSNTCCVLPQDSHPLPQNMHTITGDSSPISDSNPAVQDNTCNKNINSHFSNQLSVINTAEELPMRHNGPLSPRNASFEVLKDPGVLSLSSGQQLETASPPSTALVRQVDISADDPISGEKEKTKISISTDDEPRAPSCDWQQHFDVSLGRTVYINKITGLSTFNAPQEDSLAACTKDLTTLAVNVVFGNDTVDETAGPDSLQTLFSEWENPVFARYPEVALDVSSEQAESLKVKIHNILYPYRFTKEMVHSMQVLQQVDNKFIACLMSTKWEANGKAGGNLLVLVDQHAAHERIRLEQLICDSYEKEQPESFRRKKLLSSTISPPMEVMVTEQQRRLLQLLEEPVENHLSEMSDFTEEEKCYHKALEDLGLKLLFPDAPSSHVLVREVPLCFVEREANEVRRGRPTVTKSILEELIREQVELLQTTGGAQGTLPLTIQKVLASQACHGAIKFNDSLSLEESCRLIEALSQCQLPFQCAHGRPSMLPLADIDHLEQEKQHPKPNLAKLCKMARAWHLFKKADS